MVSQKIGAALESRLDRVEQLASKRPAGALLLGVMLAGAVITGGIVTFALVFLVLVTVFR
jgi:hypothetical protein